MTIALIVVLLSIIGILAWAFMGGEKKPVSAPEDESARTFRRRASDKKIEEEYPEEKKKQHRRRSDSSSDEDEDESVLPDTPFELPYSADEIIPETSRYKIYHRTLMNSEIYAKKGDFETAISLYDGVRTRINDTEVRVRIDEDIDYLNKYKARKERKEQKKVDSAMHTLKDEQKQSFDTSEIKISFDGSVPDSIKIDKMPESINVGVMTPGSIPDSDAIASAVASQLKNDLRDVKENLKALEGAGSDFSGKGPDTGEGAGQPRADAGGLSSPAYTDGMSPGSGVGGGTPGVESLSQEDIRGLKNLQQTIELEDIKNSMKKIAGGPALDEGISGIKESARSISDLKDDIGELNKTVRELAENRIIESESKPALAEAKFQAPPAGGPTSRDVQEMIKAIPHYEAPPERPITGPSPGPEMERPPGEGASSAGGTQPSGEGPQQSQVAGTQPSGEGPQQSQVAGVQPSGEGPQQSHSAESAREQSQGVSAFPGAASPPVERIVEKEKAGEAEESDTDFELISEYGKDNEGDQLSDEEIFEKILRDGTDKTKDQFEIIGEKREAGIEYDINDRDLARKHTEDEKFYKKVLNTDKRKRRELPILKVTYDFSRLPEESGLSREKNLMEYSFYKYKPLLDKAEEYLKRRKVRDAINYYKVVMGQNIPPEFKGMIRKNLNDLNEYLEKYLVGD